MHSASEMSIFKLIHQLFLLHEKLKKKPIDYLMIATKSYEDLIFILINYLSKKKQTFLIN